MIYVNLDNNLAFGNLSVILIAIRFSMQIIYKDFEFSL